MIGDETADTSGDGPWADRREGQREIVVGLDQSEPGRVALAWAAGQAEATGAVLRAVHVLEWPTGLSTAGFPRPLDFLDITPDELDPEYRKAIEDIFDAVPGHPGWRLQFAIGDAGHILVRLSSEAAMLVIGTRVHAGLRRLVNGSVSHYCLAHAVCPVVAIPAGTPADATGSHPAASSLQQPESTADDAQGDRPEKLTSPPPVIVGVDGSAESVAAARYGVATADRLGTAVTLVHAYSIPSRSRGADEAAASATARSSADRLLEAIVAQLVPAPRTSLHAVAELGEAVQVLSRRGGDAALLVVGRDELVWHERIFPGAVASEVAARVSCPVAVVPRGWRPRHVGGAPPVVVALDAESRSESTIKVAVREAQLRGAPIVVLHAEPIGAPRRQRDAAKYALAVKLSRWKHLHPEIGIRSVMVGGDTDANLVRWSRSAQVLVVGRPQQAGWRSWSRSVPGSVMRRTHCPLIIAPPEGAESASDDPVAHASRGDTTP